jgi:2-polyprenyl-3-methyl-5-hydroxy-6-metoxy-1,4-benzoquinol methylase
MKSPPTAQNSPAQPADYFDREYFEFHAGKRRYVRWLIERMRRHGATAGRVLDYGCGFGFFLDELAASGFEPHGIDVSSAAVEQANRRVPGRALVVPAGSALPFADASFDAVTMLDVIEHVPDLDQALAEVRRCLAPGGLFLVITLNEESLLHRAIGRRWSWFQDPTHVHLFGPENLRQALETRGFAIEALSTIWNFCVVGETTRWLRPLRGLGRVVEWRRRGDALLVAARAR